MAPTLQYSFTLPTSVAVSLAGVFTSSSFLVCNALTYSKYLCNPNICDLCFLRIYLDLVCKSMNKNLNRYVLPVDGVLQLKIANFFAAIFPPNYYACTSPLLDRNIYFNFAHLLSKLKFCLPVVLFLDVLHRFFSF